MSKGRAFLDAVENGTEPPATARDGCRAAVVTMAAYESGRRNERVALAELSPFAEELL